MKKIIAVLSLLICIGSLKAQIPDPEQGLRAEWMRGTHGLNWKPVETENGKSESEDLSILPFLDQIKDLRTVDYIQVHLNESFTRSPVHLGPHTLLESLWQGDVDSNGDPLNLVVPRAASGKDPFLYIVKDVREAGLKVQVYLNSSNMLERWRTIDDSLQQLPNPSAIPDITERWKTWCDTSSVAQAFIDSKSYHRDPDWPERHYMFCYAEFILKEYALRYGNLIDAWLFDSGRWMWEHNGDNRSSDSVDEQRIYQAFADACHAGNPDAAIAFNNSPGSSDLVNNPFTDATLFDDYMFGHPFNGGKNLGDVEANYFSLQWIAERKGYVHTNDGKSRTWDDRVVGHFDPPMATGRWNYGKTPALTNEEFVEWYSLAILGGGAMSPGIPLLDPTSWNYLFMEDYALEQLSLLDAHLMANHSPGAPNWARQATILPEAYAGQAYYFTLLEGLDFWDPEGDPITALYLLPGDNYPSWLSISESELQAGTFILGGIPTETGAYSFRIRVEDASGGTDREVRLKVLDNPFSFTDPGDGSPVWYADTLPTVYAKALDTFNILLVQGREFYDFEGDTLSVSIVEGADWLNMQELSHGTWQMGGIPPDSVEGANYVSLSVSDGSHSSETIIQINVDPVDYLEYVNVQIKAAANTFYGINTIARMISDTITAPDGLATFQISVDVRPQEGKSISSGITGGVSTTKSWGLSGDGREATKDFLFFGDSADWVDVGNIQPVNFNANGGSLSLSDFRDITFDSVRLVNAQSANKDAVAFVENGVYRDIGNVGGSPYAIDIDDVANFSIGCGDSPDQSKNKWSVEGLGVKYDMGVFHAVNIISNNGSVLTKPEQTAFRPGEQVRLVAIPDEYYQFDSWSGDTTGARIDADTLILVMDSEKNISAEYSLLSGIVQANKTLDFTVSPNPSHGIFHIDMITTGQSFYTVYSTNGTAILHGKADGPFDIDLSAFEKGLFLLKIKTDQAYKVKKLILN